MNGTDRRRRSSYCALASVKPTASASNTCQLCCHVSPSFLSGVPLMTWPFSFSWPLLLPFPLYIYLSIHRPLVLYYPPSPLETTLLFLHHSSASGNSQDILRKCHSLEVGNWEKENKTWKAPKPPLLLPATCLLSCPLALPSLSRFSSRTDSLWSLSYVMILWK